MKNTRVVIISHVFASGPAQALLEYLTEKNRAKEVLFVGHPLFYQPRRKRGSFFVLYRRGRKVGERSQRNVWLPSLVAWVKDVLLSLWWVFGTKGKWDLLICVDGLNTLAGVVLKKLGKARRVIFYTVDYGPRRFENKLINKAYHLIDRIGVYHADEVWNLSSRMEEARRKSRGIRTPPGKQKVVPMGIWFDRIKRIPFEEIEKHTLVFMGHLLEKQGVQTVIRAIPTIIKEIPDFRFLVIGTGEFEEELKKLSRQVGVENCVEFTGYIANHEEMENLMAKRACAIALYQKGDRESNLTYYADPGKIKDYLCAGLPIILTDVPHNARDIENDKCGRIIDSDPESIANAVVNLMSNEEMLLEYRQNAVNYARRFDWSQVFAKALGSQELADEN